MLESVGELIRPEAGELLWDAGDAYDLYFVVAGGVLLLDRRDDRVVVVVEAGDFVGELGMLMRQPRLPRRRRPGRQHALASAVADLSRLVATPGNWVT